MRHASHSETQISSAQIEGPIPDGYVSDRGLLRHSSHASEKGAIRKRIQQLLHMDDRDPVLAGRSRRSIGLPPSDFPETGAETGFLANYSIFEKCIAGSGRQARLNQRGVRTISTINHPKSVVTRHRPAKFNCMPEEEKQPRRRRRRRKRSSRRRNTPAGYESRGVIADTWGDVVWYFKEEAHEAVQALGKTKRMLTDMFAELVARLRS